MNYKKGLVRIFIVSSISVFLWSSTKEIVNDTQSLNYSKNYAAKDAKDVIGSLNNPICLDAIKKNSPNSLEWTRDLDNSCYRLSFYYDDVKALLDNKKAVDQVSEKDIKDMLIQRQELQLFKRAAFKATAALLIFWGLLYLVYVAFRILQWVYKGFK